MGGDVNMNEDGAGGYQYPTEEITLTLLLNRISGGK